MNTILAKIQQKILATPLTKIKGRNKLLTIDEASKLSGIDHKMLYYYIKVKKLTAYKPYGKLLVRESDLEKFTKQ